MQPNHRIDGCLLKTVTCGHTDVKLRVKPVTSPSEFHNPPYLPHTISPVRPEAPDQPESDPRQAYSRFLPVFLTVSFRTWALALRSCQRTSVARMQYPGLFRSFICAPTTASMHGWLGSIQHYEVCKVRSFFTVSTIPHQPLVFRPLSCHRYLQDTQVSFSSPHTYIFIVPNHL